MFDFKKILGFHLREQTLLEIFQDFFFDRLLGLRMFDSSKGGKFSFTYFLEIINNNFVFLVTDHFYHFFNFFNGMRLVYTL